MDDHDVGGHPAFQRTPQATVVTRIEACSRLFGVFQAANDRRWDNYRWTALFIQRRACVDCLASYVRDCRGCTKWDRRDSLNKKKMLSMFRLRLCCRWPWVTTNHVKPPQFLHFALCIFVIGDRKDFKFDVHVEGANRPWYGRGQVIWPIKNFRGFQLYHWNGWT